MIRESADRPGPRRGFSLVEVVVALVILAVGALGIAGVAATASRMLERAAAAEGAAAAAALVMDSLVVSGKVSEGRRAVGRYTVRWSVGEAAGVRRIELTVEFGTHGGGRDRTIEFVALDVPVPKILVRAETP